MAVTAVNAIVANVVPVRKLHRLLDGNVHLVAVGEIDAHQRKTKERQTDGAADDRELGDCIATRMKNLSHVNAFKRLR
jgi:hypothetical protein